MFEEVLPRRSCRLAETAEEAKVDAETSVVARPQDETEPPVVAGDELELAVGVGLARAEAEVFAAESCLAMADSRVRALAGTVARLKALALQVGLLRPAPIVLASPPPPIDDLTRERARRALARSGFVKVMP